MRVLAFILMLMLGNRASIQAQRSTALAIGMRQVGVPEASHTPPSHTIRVESTRPAAWPFVALGGLLGGTAATLWIVHAVKKSNDGIVPPAAVVIPIVGGVVLGSFAGWVVYEITYWPQPAT